MVQRTSLIYVNNLLFSEYIIVEQSLLISELLIEPGIFTLTSTHIFETTTGSWIETVIEETPTEWGGGVSLTKNTVYYAFPGTSFSNTFDHFHLSILKVYIL